MRTLFAVGLLLAVAITSNARVNVATPVDSGDVAVWIFFTDKHFSGLQKTTVSQKALARRQAAGYRGNNESDIAVSQQYIDAICTSGGRLRHTNKWENAASFSVDAAIIPVIKKLPGVKRIAPVGRYSVERGPVVAATLGKRLISNNDDSMYGALYSQLQQLNVPAAHRYLQAVSPNASPGEGVIIAIFDNGFRLDHRSFSHLHKRAGIVATRNFVDVATSSDTNVYTTDSHGTYVLSIIAGYDPPYFTGTAWGANFLLARTEADEYESHIEEDNWAAAVIWAEEHGADIISSSVGYKDFDSLSTVTIVRSDGERDTLSSYLTSDLDGATTIISRAARGAVERGVIVVNAVGNEQVGQDSSTLCAPADVAGVIAVGALDSRNNIESYSSTGPAADGRIKPDVVAPGGIWMFRIQSPNDTMYTLRTTGTSFAAPFVSGVCALVKQQYSALTADSLRMRLYRFCRYVNRQYRVDNVHGYGIPDGVRSCMQDNEVFIRLVDTAGAAFAGAVITADDSPEPLAVSDSFGHALFRSPDLSGGGLTVTKSGMQRRVASSLTTPYYLSVEPCSLNITLVDEEGAALVNRDVHFGYKAEHSTLTTDSSGTVCFVRFFPDEVRYYCVYPGYLATDTFSIVLRDSLQSATITMKRVDYRFIVYPTVLHRSSGQELIIHYDPIDAVPNSDVIAVVQSIDGTLLWKKVTTAHRGEKISWNGKNGHGTRCSPGIYFATILHNGKAYRKKFIIVE